MQESRRTLKCLAWEKESENYLDGGDIETTSPPSENVRGFNIFEY
jgi:hypothetical protein